MSAVKHTPGPWTIERYGARDSLVVHSDADTRVCFMATPGLLGSLTAIEANARLIAAAPEMLEALRIDEALYTQGYTTRAAKALGPDAEAALFCGGGAGLAEWARVKRRAAIAKAEGRS